MGKTHQIAAAAVVATLAAMTLSINRADALGGARYYEDGERITVEALDGSGAIVVPVRVADRGYEVYVPKWGWTDCELGDCEHTVRKWHFHFWEWQTDKGIGTGRLGRFLFGTD